MAAEDELALPQVPEAKPNDPEDVSWALSTAEAMWARGDHLEGIKWVRKAAEAASEVEKDERALELAKAASELATIVARRSHASQGGSATTTAQSADTPTAQSTDTPTALPGPLSAEPVPSPARSSRPPPPIAWPSRAAQPARTFSPSGGTAIPRTFSPPGAIAVPPRSFSPSPGAAVPRPPTSPPPRSFSPAAGVAQARPGPAPPVPIAPGSAPTAPGSLPIGEDRVGASETRRARDDAPAADSQPTIFTGEKATAKVVRPSDPDPTIVARFEDVQQHRDKSLAWDGSTTKRGSEDAELPEGDRLTAFAMAAAPIVTAAPPVRPPQSTIHDPEIQTSQAVRVVVWRDASGVHVAPAGTVVSAITIDAVLVVLEEGADLTAWLSQRSLR